MIDLTDPRLVDAIENEARLLRVRQAAKRMVAAEDLGELVPFEISTPGTILQQPRPKYRVDRMLLHDAFTLVVAQHKVGKTTFGLNLAQSLVCGTDLLGRFAVTTPLTGNVAFLNFEVSDHLAAEWSADLRPVIPEGRLHLVNLRGRRNPFSVPEDLERLAAQLRALDVEVLMVDPFGQAFPDESENDAGQVNRFLRQLQEFKVAAGAVDLVLTAHAGKSGDGARGSTALEGGADNLVYLTRDARGARYLRAGGRIDEPIEEDQLAFDPATRRLTLTGAGAQTMVAKQSVFGALVPAIVAALEQEPGLGVAELTGVLRTRGIAFQDRDVSTAVRVAIDSLQIRVDDQGPGKKRLHYALPRATPSNPVQTPSVDGPSNPVQPRLYGRGGGGQGLAVVPDWTGSPSEEQRILLDQIARGATPAAEEV